MKNYILFALFLTTVSFHAQDLSTLYDKVNPAVVVILTEEKEFINLGNTNKAVTSSGLGQEKMLLP